MVCPSSFTGADGHDHRAEACQIRVAEKADFLCLQKIERAADKLFPAGRLPDPDDVMPLEELVKAQGNGLLLVASWEGTIAGFAVSQVSEGSLHLAGMAVHPDFGRRGIGTQLLTAVIQQTVDRKLSSITLTTFRDLPWNAPFYEKRGFRILSDSELSPMLRDILEQEERLGMKHRVAMVYLRE
ncbi:MAG: GNAT family N-acetyltransferase [Leptolyngbya sp. SIO1D8]|nr:GNAT family N-acetyltransferase [Leptolyngbya sp. SIO1D8]